MDLKEMLKGKEFNIEKLSALMNTNAVACVSDTDEGVACQSETVNLDGLKAITWDGNTEGLEGFSLYYKVSDAVPSANNILGGVVAYTTEDGQEYIMQIIAIVNEETGESAVIDGINPEDESTFPELYAVALTDGKDHVIACKMSDGNMPLVIINSEENSALGASAGTYFTKYTFYTSMLAYKDTSEKDYLVKNTTLSNIADSIRSKLGTSTKMLLEDMPSAIKSIATVGDSITITWDGQATEESYNDKYYKVSDLYFNGAQLSNATVTLTNGTEEVTGKFTDSRWYTGMFVTGSSGIAWGLDLMLFSTDGTSEDLGVSKGTYIGIIASGDYSGYWVSSITYPVTPDVLLQEKTITANGTYSADEGYNGLSKVTVEVASGGSSRTIVTASSVTITNADVSVEDGSTIVIGG